MCNPKDSYMANQLATPRARGDSDAPHLEIAGPREERFGELGKLVVAKGQLPLRVEVVSNPSDPDSALYESGAILPGPEAVLAGPTFEEWIDANS